MLNLTPREEYRLAVLTTERLEARVARTKSAADIRALALVAARRRALLPLLSKENLS